MVRDSWSLLQLPCLLIGCNIMFHKILFHTVWLFQPFDLFTIFSGLFQHHAVWLHRVQLGRYRNSQHSVVWRLQHQCLYSLVHKQQHPKAESTFSIVFWNPNIENPLDDFWICELWAVIYLEQSIFWSTQSQQTRRYSRKVRWASRILNYWRDRGFDCFPALRVSGKASCYYGDY